MILPHVLQEDKSQRMNKFVGEGSKALVPHQPVPVNPPSEQEPKSKKQKTCKEEARARQGEIRLSRRKRQAATAAALKEEKKF